MRWSCISVNRSNLDEFRAIGSFGILLDLLPRRSVLFSFFVLEINPELKILQNNQVASWSSTTQRIWLSPNIDFRVQINKLKYSRVRRDSYSIHAHVKAWNEATTCQTSEARSAGIELDWEPWRSGPANKKIYYEDINHRPTRPCTWCALSCVLCYLRLLFLVTAGESRCVRRPGWRRCIHKMGR